MLDPIVENKIIYIPVEEATDGGTPMLNNKGLKIVPPPKPSAPDTQPPIVAKMTNLTIVLPWNLTSDSIRPFPTFTFSFYSIFTILIAIVVTRQHKAMNIMKNDQPNTLQVDIPMIDCEFLPPLNKITNI